jgi:hypothetical protein
MRRCWGVATQLSRQNNLSLGLRRRAATASPHSGSPATSATPLDKFLRIAGEGNLSAALIDFEQRFKPTSNFREFCGPNLWEASDYAMLLMKTYHSLSRMDNVKTVFLIALRDVPDLRTPFFDHYLQILSQQTHFSRKEVLWVLGEMQKKGLPWSERTYAALIEIHIRMGIDPRALWDELLNLSTSLETHPQGKTDPSKNGAGSSNLLLSSSNTDWADNAAKAIEAEPVLDPHGVANAFVRRSIVPSPALLKAMAQNVTFHHKDVRYVIEVMRRLIACSAVDHKLLLYVFQSLVHNPQAGADHALWILFELEQRCVFERRSLRELVYRPILLQLLWKCAVSGDHVSAGRVLAFMERHLIQRNADALSMMVWCFAVAEQVEAAFDAVEEMHRKSLLTQMDPFKKHQVDVVGHTGRHFLMVLADSLHTTQLVDRAYFYLENRRKEGKSVSIHSLDIVVLACAKLSDEGRAAETMEAYPSFGVTPRTQTYNYLLMACSGRLKSRKHADVLAAMQRAGVPANGTTYRHLIRQALLCDDIEEAFALLDKVTKTDGLKVEVEMILPIFERASRVGDLPTCLKMCKFALDHSLGLDPQTIKTAAKRLSSEFECDVSELHNQCPLHEKLRANFKRRK